MRLGKLKQRIFGGHKKVTGNKDQISSSRRRFLGHGFLAALGGGLFAGSRGATAQETSQSPASGMVIEGRRSNASSRLRFSDGIEAAWKKIKVNKN